MAEQRENIGNIYPNLPYVVLEKIKKYHRLANAEVEPKKTVLGELKRVKQYSTIFERNFKPSFIMKLRRLQEIDQKYDEIMALYRKIGPGEVEYFRTVMINEIVHGSFTVEKERIVMKLQEHEVYMDERDKVYFFE